MPWVSQLHIQLVSCSRRCEYCRVKKVKVRRAEQVSSQLWTKSESYIINYNLCDWIHLLTVFKQSAEKKIVKCIHKAVTQLLRRWVCEKKMNIYHVHFNLLIFLGWFLLIYFPYQHNWKSPATFSFWLSAWWMIRNNITILSFTIFAHLLMPVHSSAVTPAHCGPLQKPFSTNEWLTYLCFVTFILRINSSQISRGW